MDKMFSLKLNTTAGLQEVPFSLDDYQAAFEQKMTFADYINTKVETGEDNPSAFDQIRAITGLVESEDRHSHRGFRASTLNLVLDDKIALNSAIVRPDGSKRNDPAGRFFFPAVFLEMAEDTLRDNRASYTAAFLDMVSHTVSIAGPSYDQILINYDEPRRTRSEIIAQLAEPKRLLSITTSMRSKALPTWSLGMEISDQAMASASLDLVRIAFREQASEERALRLNEDFMSVVNGDVDVGEAGLLAGAISAYNLDPSLTAPGTMSQDAWVLYLAEKWMRRRITHVVCNLRTYLAIEKRLGRPIKAFEPAQDERLNTVPRMAVELIPGGVKVFPMENFPDNLIVGLDNSKALRRVVQTTASYSAVEPFVMRRSTAFRIDHSERVESIGWTDAFEVLTLDGAPDVS